VPSHRLAAFLALVFGAVFCAHAERLPFRTYTTEHGLAGDAVWDLLQDSRGFLWIATSSGLSRFDGQVFRNYDTAEGLPSTRVFAVVETRDGAIWVGTAEGVARLDPRSGAGGPPFHVEPFPAGISEPLSPGVRGGAVGCLYGDRAGRLWVCVDRDLLVLDDPTASLARARRFELPSGVQGVAAVAQDAEGSLWGATPNGLLRLLPDGTSRLYPVRPPENDIPVVALDHQGRVWTGGGGGIYIFWPDPAGSVPARAGDRPASLHARSRRPAWPGELPSRPGEVLLYDRASGLADSFVYSISVRSSDAVWAATRGGVSQFSAGGLSNIVPSQGLPEPAITAILEDRDGTLWLGTESRGLARLARSGFTAFGAEDGLAHDRVSSVFEDDQGELYVVTFGRDLHHFDGRRFAGITPRLVLRDARGGWGWNQFFLRDRKGGWWVPTSDGLYHFPPVARPGDLAAARPLAHYSLHKGLSTRDVFRVFEDRHGDVWASVLAAPPLVRFRGGSGPPETIPEVARVADRTGSPTAFAEDREGNLWIGFYAGGLARLRGGSWRFFGTADGVPPGFIADLHLDRAGRLWLASSSGGAARIDGAESATPRFVPFTTAQGLTTNAARCLTDDAAGRLYIGTSRGIDRLDPRTGRVLSFTTADGLPNSLVWHCYTARDGRLWFGTLHGLARFDPGAEPSRRRPVVLLSGLQARGLVRAVPDLGIPEVSGWVLQPKQDALQIDYLALASTGVLFQHKLEGRGEDWSLPTPSRSVVFPQLASGHYRLLVRAVTHDGLVSASPAAVSFQLLAPVWRRPWFLALMAAGLAAAAWGGYRLRVRRLLALERMRTNIASDLHDDLGSSLSRIGLLGELARERVVSAPEETSEMLGRIAEEARELTEATADIVWAVDPRQDDLGSLAVRLRRFAADLLAARGIRLNVDVPVDAAAVLLSPQVRRALHMALKEAIHNVAKHSGARQAWLSIAIHDGEIQARVRDDGIGIADGAAAAAQAAGRRGLSGLKERARGVGGELEIVSAPGEGTRVEMRVPARRGKALA
jgi:ligand-binding sensor domain-containing protein/signal transduction histidine kinase